jgi:hypothetical protein
MMNTERYLDPHQARRRPCTPYEDLLGDSIERAFGSGITELEPLVEFLNKSGPMASNGQAWTPALYTAQISALGEQS